VTLHREAWGGEKFFEMLERTWNDATRWIDLMELQYLCIAMGFAGKYQVQDRGQTRLRGNSTRTVSTHSRSSRRGAAGIVVALGAAARSTQSVIAIGAVVGGRGGGTGDLDAGVYLFLRGLSSNAAPVEAQLAKIGLSDFTAPAIAVPLVGPTLKQLLADDERAGTVVVEEQGGRTLITLVASNLFGSASATVNPDFYATMRHIAAAINQVPGRVLVWAIPTIKAVRSLRYATTSSYRASARWRWSKC